MPDLNLGDLTITSPSFGACDSIPDRFAHDGGNRSPALSWSHVPDGTVELALVVHDPDAPLTDGFTHWVVVGIDPTSDGLPEDAHEGVTMGINSVGDAHWMGPAPPPAHGTHHYFFHLYALDRAVDTAPLPTREALLAQIDGHIIEQARVVGTYRND